MVEIMFYFRPLIFWFCLINLNGVWSIRDPRDEFYDHVVVQPNIYSASREKRDLNFIKVQNERQLIVTFLAFQKEFMLDLWMNPLLLPATYFEKYQENGSYVFNFPLKKSQHHCHYHGKLKNSSDSYAAISTCQGLSGVMDDGREMYYIEPDTTSNNDSHFLFRAKDLKPRNSTCGVSDSQYDRTDHHHFESLKRNRRYSVEKDLSVQNWETRYVEMVVVNDNSQFKKYKEDKKAVFQRTKDIVNAMDAMYSALNIHIVLLGVIIWSEKDEIDVDDDSSVTLNSFVKYRAQKLSEEHPNDNAQFITGKKFIKGILGLAYTGPICTRKLSGAVSMDNTALAAHVAATVSHELAHNFGVRHDEKECACADRLCLMHRYDSKDVLHHWSSCSIEKFEQGFMKGLDVCLHNYPAQIMGPVCGNQFLEKGEECDCGIEPFCKSNCCDARTCKLKPGAKCYNGECCDTNTCQVKNASSVCRSEASECDLPEYCDGVNSWCPADVFQQNGQICQNGAAYCYNGQCESHRDRCRLLWGQTADDTDYQCYRSNVRGNFAGNCGYDLKTKSLKKCSSLDVLCGMLHCTNNNYDLKYLVYGENKIVPGYIVYKNVKITCLRVMFDVSFYDRDPGLVPQGAKCGIGNMCVNETCVAASSILDESCSKKCNGHGVCNNNKNCHCDMGYKPPDCLLPGSGGSIDSGPPALLLRASPTTMKSIITLSNKSDSEGNNPNSLSRSTTVALYSVFLGVLPLLLISIGVGYYYRNPIKIWFSKKSGGAESAVTLDTENNVDEDVSENL